MITRYIRVRACGGPSHHVELYENYSKEAGVWGFVKEQDSPRMTDAIRDLPLTKPQRRALMEIMRQRSDGIITETGDYYPY